MADDNICLYRRRRGEQKWYTCLPWRNGVGNRSWSSFCVKTEDQTEEEGKVWEESKTDGFFCRLYL